MNYRDDETQDIYTTVFFFFLKGQIKLSKKIMFAQK